MNSASGLGCLKEYYGNLRDLKSECSQSKFLKGVDPCLLIYATTRITYILRTSTWKFLQTERRGMILKLVILNPPLLIPDTRFYHSNNI